MSVLFHILATSAAIVNGDERHLWHCIGSSSKQQRNAMRVILSKGHVERKYCVPLTTTTRLRPRNILKMRPYWRAHFSRAT